MKPSVGQIVHYRNSFLTEGEPEGIREQPMAAIVTCVLDTSPRTVHLTAWYHWGWKWEAMDVRWLSPDGDRPEGLTEWCEPMPTGEK